MANWYLWLGLKSDDSAVSVAQRPTCSAEAMHPSSAFSFVTSEILMTDQHYAALDRL
jgi:hypothetical protein